MDPPGPAPAAATAATKDPAPGEAPPGRRPVGITLVAVFYLVLGAHALMFGLWALTVNPSTAPSLPFEDLLRRDPGIVQAYGALLVGIAAAFVGNGLALAGGRWWARWTTVLVAPLHFVGPPFMVGGILFAALVNLYLFGSGRSRAYFEARRAAPPAGPAPQP